MERGDVVRMLHSQPLANTAHVDARAHCEELKRLGENSHACVARRVHEASRLRKRSADGIQRPGLHLRSMLLALQRVHQLQLVRLARLDVADRENEWFVG